MVGLLSVPGAGRAAIPQEPELDDVARSLAATAIMVHCAGSEQLRGFPAMLLMRWSDLCRALSHAAAFVLLLPA